MVRSRLVRLFTPVLFGVGISLMPGCGGGGTSTASAVGQAGPDIPADQMKAIVDDLNSKDPKKRAQAATTLGDMGSRALIFTNMLEEKSTTDPSSEVKKAAADAVKKLQAIAPSK